MLFKIETDLHISDLLKLTNDVTCDILIYSPYIQILV